MADFTTRQMIEQCQCRIDDQNHSQRIMDINNVIEAEDPEGKDRYEFIGPGVGDPRLSEHRCKEIIKRVPESGVTLKRARELVDKYGDEGKDLDSLTPGFQCRHTWSKVI